jgi:hypothetical protein
MAEPDPVQQVLDRATPQHLRRRRMERRSNAVEGLDTVQPLTGIAGGMIVLRPFMVTSMGGTRTGGSTRLQSCPSRALANRATCAGRVAFPTGTGAERVPRGGAPPPRGAERRQRLTA